MLLAEVTDAYLFHPNEFKLNHEEVGLLDTLKKRISDAI